MKLDLFFDRMKTYLSADEFALFEASYEQVPYKGLRINTLKINVDEFLQQTNIALAPTRFSKEHFYVHDELSGNHPYHLAGLFYMQEPSAGSAAEALDIQPGDFVMDMCAAPGGKSTQIAAKLNHQGLLVSNEIVSSRAQILLSNIERMGVSNAIITNMHPYAIADLLPQQFNKILVDAPCSGEGMFRKDAKARDEWSPQHVMSCAVRQQPILDAAYQCLQPGGALVYSTCTFSKEENEDVITAFLTDHNDMELMDVKIQVGHFGLSNSSINPALVRRVYPMDGGEGHFVAKMVKKVDGETKRATIFFPPKAAAERDMKIVQGFLDDQLSDYDHSRIYIHNETAYYVPAWICDFKKLKLVRAGICIGEIKNGMIRPHHHFYMGLPANQYKKAITLSLHDERLIKFLRGMEITDDDHSFTGYCSIQVDGFAIGFGKKSGSTIKNHYPKGLRLY